METKPVLCKAIEGGFASLSSPAPAKIVIADLGCSSGPNTLLVVSGVIGMISTSGYLEKTELQFFLNDLPGNDFNYVFRSLQQLKQLADRKERLLEPPYYIAGLPGSFYTRLFPCQSVHLFHCSYALMWRSKVHTAYDQIIPKLTKKNARGNPIAYKTAQHFFSHRKGTPTHNYTNIACI